MILFAHRTGPQYGPQKGSVELVRWLRARVHRRIRFPIIERPSQPTWPLFVVGHSLGGSVAALLAGRGAVLG